MYFKIAKEEPLYTDLIKVKKKMLAAKKASQKLCKEVGAKDVYTNSSHHAAGGIDGFGFDKEPDMKLWRYVAKKWQGIYMPRSVKENKDLFKKISQLPTVDIDEINDPLGFTGDFVSGDSPNVLMVHIRTPHVIWEGKLNHILVQVDDRVKKYKPKPGMVEIIGTEYKNLGGADD